MEGAFGFGIAFSARNSCADDYATEFLVSGTQAPRGAFCARDPDMDAPTAAQLRAAEEASP